MLNNIKHISEYDPVSCGRSRAAVVCLVGLVVFVNPHVPSNEPSNQKQVPWSQQWGYDFQLFFAAFVSQ